MTKEAQIIYLGPYIADRRTSEISDLVTDLALAEQHAFNLMDKLSALGSSSMVLADPRLRENVVNAMHVVEAACSAYELARDEMAVATNCIYLTLFSDQMPELPELSKGGFERFKGFDLEEVVREIEAGD
ncbi:hypothetical protein ELG63_36315 [Rhizobium leguminosarum]|uniref:hypothetical protein n=1 Tax=Rhizobium leguminosarum TaxID=384 RepID=UPI00102F691B|nr:hypothetical protein [Rhizobium leguminosarum]TBH28154.1 hypothetical protein ELG63_36315 [Rhizobium leguminosarum]